MGSIGGSRRTKVRTRRELRQVLSRLLVRESDVAKPIADALDIPVLSLDNQAPSLRQPISRQLIDAAAYTERLFEKLLQNGLIHANTNLFIDISGFEGDMLGIYLKALAFFARKVSEKGGMITIGSLAKDPSESLALARKAGLTVVDYMDARDSTLILSSQYLRLGLTLPDNARGAISYQPVQAHADGSFGITNPGDLIISGIFIHDLAYQLKQGQIARLSPQARSFFNRKTGQASPSVVTMAASRLAKMRGKVGKLGLRALNTLQMLQIRALLNDIGNFMRRLVESETFA